MCHSPVFTERINTSIDDFFPSFLSECLPRLGRLGSEHTTYVIRVQKVSLEETDVHESPVRPGVPSTFQCRLFSSRFVTEAES